MASFCETDKLLVTDTIETSGSGPFDRGMSDFVVPSKEQNLPANTYLAPLLREESSLLWHKKWYS